MGDKSKMGKWGPIAEQGRGPGYTGHGKGWGTEYLLWWWKWIRHVWTNSPKQKTARGIHKISVFLTFFHWAEGVPGYSTVVSGRKYLCRQYCDDVESPCFLPIKALCKDTSKFHFFITSDSNLTYPTQMDRNYQRKQELCTWIHKEILLWFPFSFLHFLPSVHLQHPKLTKRLLDLRKRPWSCSLTNAEEFCNRANLYPIL